MLCTTKLLLSVVKYRRKQQEETTIDWTEGKYVDVIYDRTQQGKLSWP